MTSFGRPTTQTAARTGNQSWMFSRLTIREVSKTSPETMTHLAPDTRTGRERGIKLGGPHRVLPGHFAYPRTSPPPPPSRPPNESQTMPRESLLLLLLAALCWSPSTSAFSAPPQQGARRRARPSFASAGQLEPEPEPVRAAAPAAGGGRRGFLASSLAGGAAAATAALGLPLPPALAADSKEEMVSQLTDSLERLRPIPSLLAQAEWEKTRNILKTPPVNELWNLGDSKNTLVRLAKETGDFELLEMKDELAISLQMCDQYAYDNVFVYFQPGDGKFKVKEPTEMAERAMKQLEEAIKVVK